MTYPSRAPMGIAESAASGYDPRAHHRHAARAGAAGPVPVPAALAATATIVSQTVDVQLLADAQSAGSGPAAATTALISPTGLRPATLMGSAQAAAGPGPGPDATAALISPAGLQPPTLPGSAQAAAGTDPGPDATAALVSPTGLRPATLMGSAQAAAGTDPGPDATAALVSQTGLRPTTPLGSAQAAAGAGPGPGAAPAPVRVFCQLTMTRIGQFMLGQGINGVERNTVGFLTMQDVALLVVCCRGIGDRFGTVEVRRTVQVVHHSLGLWVSPLGQTLVSLEGMIIEQAELGTLPEEGRATALVHFARIGYSEMVQRLLSMGPLSESDMSMAIFQACMGGNRGLIHALLDRSEQRADAAAYDFLFGEVPMPQLSDLIVEMQARHLEDELFGAEIVVEGSAFNYLVRIAAQFAGIPVPEQIALGLNAMHEEGPVTAEEILSHPSVVEYYDTIFKLRQERSPILQAGLREAVLATDHTRRRLEGRFGLNDESEYLTITPLTALPSSFNATLEDNLVLTRLMVLGHFDIAACYAARLGLRDFVRNIFNWDGFFELHGISDACRREGSRMTEHFPTDLAYLQAAVREERSWAVDFLITLGRNSEEELFALAQMAIKEDKHHLLSQLLPNERSLSEAHLAQIVEMQARRGARPFHVDALREQSLIDMMARFIQEGNSKAIFVLSHKLVGRSLVESFGLAIALEKVDLFDTLAGFVPGSVNDLRPLTAQNLVDIVERAEAIRMGDGDYYPALKRLCDRGIVSEKTLGVAVALASKQSPIAYPILKEFASSYYFLD